jgi:hypothetical protein
LSKIGEEKVYICGLVDINEMLVPIPGIIDAEEGVDRAFVFDFDALGQLVKESFTVFFLADSFDVVNVNCDKKFSSDVNASVRFQSRKPQVDDDAACHVYIK